MDQPRIEKIYNDLEAFVVELAADPIVLGPGYLQDLISKTRGFLNTVSIYTQEAHRERHYLERDLDAKQSAFDISADELLANDNRVKHLPSIDDRKSMINLLLSTERREIEDIKRQVRSLGHVEKAIRHRQRELTATMSAIRLQRSLIQSELKTGSMYGDENDKSRGDAWGRTRSAPACEDIDEEELDKLLSSADQELNGEESDAEEVAEAEPESEDEPDLSTFDLAGLARHRLTRNAEAESKLEEEPEALTGTGAIDTEHPDFTAKGVESTDIVTVIEPEGDDPLVDEDDDDVTFETDEALTFEAAPEDEPIPTPKKSKKSKKKPVYANDPDVVAFATDKATSQETGLDLAEDLLVTTISAETEPKKTEPEPAPEPEEEDPAIAKFLGEDDTEDFSDIFDSLRPLSGV